MSPLTLPPHRSGDLAAQVLPASEPFSRRGVGLLLLRPRLMTAGGADEIIGFKNLWTSFFLCGQKSFMFFG